MSNDRNWRTEVDAQDYFGHQKKQLQVADRRPVIRKPSDLVGPGIAASAVRITDFNDLLATYDGFFAGETGALNAPTAGQAYVGVVSSDSELGGSQVFYGLTDGDGYRRVFTRNPADASTIYWGTWDLIAGGGGGGSLTVQDENSTVATGVTQIDFQGAGVTAAAGTGEVVVTIPGGSLTVQDENSNVSTSVTQIDFQGSGVTATSGTGEVVVTIPGAAVVREALFKLTGALSVGAGATRLYNDTGATWTISSIRASVETAPSGGSVVVDVNKNGTTLFTTQANRPTITSANTTSGKVTNMDVTTVADGDYLTVDVDTTTVPAAQLTVTVVFQ